MAATALRHFVTAAGSVLGRGEGREGDPCSLPALVAWTEPSTSPACPALAMATPGLAQPLGREAGRPGPSPSPASPWPPRGRPQTRAQDRVPEATPRGSPWQWWAGKMVLEAMFAVEGPRLRQQGRLASGSSREGRVPSGPHPPLHTADLAEDLGLPAQTQFPVLRSCSGQSGCWPGPGSVHPWGNRLGASWRRQALGC